MSVDVSTQAVIAAPIATVAAFASEPDNAPRWYVNIKSVEWQTPRPIGIGSRFAFVAQFLSRRLEYVYQVIEYVPDNRLVIRTADGPFPMETTYEWEPTETGTRMRLRNRGTPSGFSRIFAPFMSAAMRRANNKDLAALKALLEAKQGDEARVSSKSLTAILLRRPAVQRPSIGAAESVLREIER
jgi:hypothetical protein